MDGPEWSRERLDAWDRRTRRLVRVGAAMLVLGALLPSPYVDREGVVRFVWYLPPLVSLDDWWASFGHWFSVDRGPYGLLALVFGVLAWRWSSTLPLLSRGVRLAVPALVLAVMGEMQHPDGGLVGAAPRLPLHWLLVLTPALGLALVRTRGAQRAGRGICAACGVIVLGLVLWPPAWSQEHLALVRELPSDTLGDRMRVMLLAGQLALMGLLVFVGLRRSRGRIAEGLALGLLVLTFALEMVEAQIQRTEGLWGGGDSRVEITPSALGLACAIASQAVWLCAAYGHLLLTGVGLYLWIAAPRRDEASVPP